MTLRLTLDSNASTSPKVKGEGWIIIVALCLVLPFFPTQSLAAQYSFTSINSISIFSPLDEEFVLIVTCRLILNEPQLYSPQVKVRVLDDEGRVLQRKSSYGGRHYSQKKLSRLGQLVASAVTASPVPIPLNQKEEQVYQFVFYGISDQARSIQASAKAAPAVTKAAKQLTQKAQLRDVSPKTSNTQSLASQTRKVFLKRPTIQSLLKERETYAPPSPKASLREEKLPRRVFPLSVERKRTALEPYGCIPLWEFLRLGISRNEASEILQQRIFPLTEVKLTPVACVANICEYTMENQPPDSTEFRLYFKENSLQSFLITIPEQGIDARRKFFAALTSIYGGKIFTGGHSLEYAGKVDELLLQTSGKYFRAFTEKE